MSSRLNIFSDLSPILLVRSSLGMAADADEAEVSFVDDACLIEFLNPFVDKFITRFLEIILTLNLIWLKLINGYDKLNDDKLTDIIS